MENQAFEEERQSRIEEETIFLRRISSPVRPFRSPTIEPFDASASSPDGHVYEDILPNVEEVSKPPSVSFDVGCVSREASSKSSEPEETSSLRRNLTLPFRRGIGHDSTVASSSVRVTSREKNVWQEEDAEVAAEDTRKSLDAFSREAKSEARPTSVQTECRPNRRRRKKDCKHCRNKATASRAAKDVRLCEDEDRESEAVLMKNRNNEKQTLYVLASNDPQIILDPCHLGMLAARSPGVGAEELEGGNDPPTVFTVSEKIAASPSNTLKLIEYRRNENGRAIENEDKALIAPEKNRAGMRVNSIYSQDRWYAKEASMFFTDVKEHGTFQRAYSLPSRTQTPSSQNRVNLRRSVRGEPPPQPARLDKHRNGWTLHLARPLEGSRCSRSAVLLLIVVLVLLGIAAVALYIVFEPEKLQIIQQYLKSSSSSTSTSPSSSPNDSSNENILSGGTFLSSLRNDQGGDDPSNGTTSTQMSSTLMASVLSSGNQSFPENSSASTETETEATNLNSTRYCDDCLAGEVCVALVDEEVPTCRIGPDREDPTGCAGFCLINKQKCHRLDVDAFRCVEVEHYCLDDEWTCSNTLCLPMDKRCDGHMNCYDHSDEYNCDCDLETHFQCGNETSCLPMERRCDGKIDCWDAADEINCTLGRNLGWSCPSENEFTCSDGQCISKARFCDGLSDCLDGSDEPHGCQGRCNKHEFTCQNSRCIGKGMKCNGIDDCGDGTDERHCKERFP